MIALIIIKKYRLKKLTKQYRIKFAITLITKKNSLKEITKQERGKGVIILIIIQNNRLKKLTKEVKNKCIVTLIMIKEKKTMFFDNVQMYSMVDPCILATSAFKVIDPDFKFAIEEGPTYV